MLAMTVFGVVAAGPPGAARAAEKSPSRPRLAPVDLSFHARAPSRGCPLAHLHLPPANQQKMSTKRLGVLTSGGDCPGLNAVIRGVVKSADQLGYECVGFLKGYEGLVDPVSYLPLNNKNTSGILNQGGTILGSTNQGRFAATRGVDERVEL